MVEPFTFRLGDILLQGRFQFSDFYAGIRRDGHLLFEVEMYLQKGCIKYQGLVQVR